MRIEKAYNGKFKNLNLTTDVMSLQEVFGRSNSAPIINKTIRLYKDNPMQLWSDAMAEVFQANTVNSKSAAVKGHKYMYQVKGVPNYTTTIATSVASNPTLGRRNQEFTICLSEEIANQNDVLWLENEQMLLVKQNAEIQADGLYKYRVQLIGNDPEFDICDTNYLQQNRRVSVGTNIQPEISRVGYSSFRDVVEERVNYLTKLRVGMTMTAEAMMADWVVLDTDRKTGKEVAVFWMSELQRKLLQELYAKREWAAIWGQCNVNPATDMPTMQTGGGQSEVGIMGDGIYQAIKREGLNEYYSRFTTQTLKDMVMAMKLRNPYSSQTMKVLLMTGIKGYQAFDTAMRDELKGLMLTENYMVDKKGSKVDVGVNFNTYNYLGTQFSVVHNPVFDDRNNMADELDSDGFPMRSSMYMALDVSSYEGTPNIQLLNRDGVNVIENWELGMGGKNGKTSGNFNRAQASSVDYLTYVGAVVHVPETCMVLRKSKVII